VSCGIEHPSWCDRRYCTATGQGEPGRHWSRPYVLGPEASTDVGVTVRISQGAEAAGQTGQAALIDLTMHLPAVDPDDTDDERSLVMRGERAVALGRMLLSAGRIAGREY
jgi:hypothetical protein